MKKNKIYLLAEIADKRYNAGEKARNDVISIIEKNNINHIKFFSKGKNKICVLFEILKSFLKTFFILRKNDILLIQYPYYPISIYKLIYKFIDVITKIKSAKKIVIIHDLNYLRNLGEDEKKIKNFVEYKMQTEIQTLNKFDCIICHNPIMKEELVKRGVKSEKLFELGLFDYIHSEEILVPKYTNKNIKVAVAGNLNKVKSGYLYKINDLKLVNIGFELYGIGYSDELKKINNVKYNGKYSPEELPRVMKVNYGLVWDGGSLNECDGMMGEYLKYNNPHKASLYLASGLPIIVWEKSALSRFVKKNGVGVTINSLFELENKLNNISEKEYYKMVNNINDIKVKLVNGEYLKNSIKSSLNYLRSN